MNRLSLPSQPVAVLALLIIATIGSRTAIAQTTDGILFLQFTVSTDDVRLAEAAVVSGNLKASSSVSGPIRLDLIDAAGSSLSHIHSNDPLLVRYCVPREDGTLESIEVAMEEAAVLVRLPYHDAAENVRVSRVDFDAAGKASYTVMAEFSLRGRLEVQP